MPKISWIKQHKRVEVNYLAAVFHAYRKATGLTSVQIGAALGVTPENARYQMNKPGKAWNVGKLMRYCDVLGIPYQEAFEAAVK